jgi:hypothetical protein
MIFLADKLTAHRDLLRVNEETGDLDVVLTSRPCEVCGGVLRNAMKPLAFLKPEERVHPECRKLIGGKTLEEQRVWMSLAEMAASGVTLPRMAGGAPAENFTNEGLTYIENIFPRQTQALPGSLYFLLFTAQTPTTVPDRTTVLATQPGTGTALVSEPAAGTGGYARAAVANTSWGAPATAGSGVETVSSQISFAQSTGTGYSPAGVNGFGISQQAAQGAGGLGLAYANFNDTTVTTVNSQGYVVQITATFHLDI